jgi:3-methyladenine DNA glycosylase/8-oxoguanine DNA glycosylase
VALRAEPLDPTTIAVPGPGAGAAEREAGPVELDLALERMRFALGVDDDLGEYYRRFRRDPLLGPLLRRRPHLRPRRRPWAWEALAWAVVKQLIESGRAARIQRRIVGRWGLRLDRRSRPG